MLVAYSVLKAGSLTNQCLQNAEQLRTPINIVVSRASAPAIAAVESIGGSVISRYYTPDSIKRILRGDSHPFASLEAIGGPLESITAMSVPATNATPAEQNAPPQRIPALPDFKY